jgi:hypothetical protein
MKKLMTCLLALTLSSTAMAKSLMPHIAMLELNGSEKELSYKATIDNYGELKVTNAAGKTIGKKSLTKKTLAVLTNYAEGLANAEIKTDQSMAVCEVMPPLSQSNLSVSRADEETGVFTGEMRLVLTEQGCWNPQKTWPTQDYQREEAIILKQVFEILFYEATKIQK